MVKAISWRFLAFIITVGVAFFWTKEVEIALEIGILDSLVKIIAYYVHERGWGWIGFGRSLHPLAHLTLTKQLTENDERVIRKKLEELGYVVPSSA
jgi:adenylylsulfate kinase